MIPPRIAARVLEVRMLILRRSGDIVGVEAFNYLVIIIFVSQRCDLLDALYRAMAFLLALVAAAAVAAAVAATAAVAAAVFVNTNYDE